MAILDDDNLKTEERTARESKIGWQTTDPVKSRLGASQHFTCIPNSAHEDVEASNHDPDVDVEEPDHKPDQKVEVKLYMAGSRIYAYMYLSLLYVYMIYLG